MISTYIVLYNLSWKSYGFLLKGSVDVTVKYKVFTPSSAMRHIAESIFSVIPVMDFLQTNQSCSCTQMKGQITDVHTGLCNYLTFACLSDLTLIWWLQHVHLFTFLNIPAERWTSLLNIALQNVALDMTHVGQSRKQSKKCNISLKTAWFFNQACRFKRGSGWFTRTSISSP